MATCRIHEIEERFKGIKCSREAWDLDYEGLCLLHSRRVDKDEDGAFTKEVRAKLKSEDYDFRGVFFPTPFSLQELTGQEKFTFTKPADFSGATFQKADFFAATFQEETRFHRSTFKGEAGFSVATFKGSADFSQANFQEKGRFHRATFNGEARFSVATFKGEAGFRRADFQGEAVFSGADFHFTARFSGATFHGEAKFIRVSFRELARFTGATFQSKARFEKLECKRPKLQDKGQPTSPVFPGDYRNIIVDKESSLVFQDSSLARVKLTGTDMRRVEFKNIIWARLHGRNVVYDEILLHQAEERPTRESCARVEELYRQLKLNYEKEGDLKNAGDFHYGEMEMHRRANPGQLWYQFYWALSGYGERPLRALLSLLIIFIGFSVLLLVVEPSLFGCSLLSSLGNALLFVFQKGTLQRPDFPKQAGVAAQVLGAIIPVIIPGQVALFFLALRNRLGRRR